MASRASDGLKDIRWPQEPLDVLKGLRLRHGVRRTQRVPGVRRNPEKQKNTTIHFF